MNLFVLLPISIIILDVAMLVYALFMGGNKRLLNSYIIFSLCLIGWLCCDAFTWSAVSIHQWQPFLIPVLKIHSIFWISIGICFLNFVYVFLKRPRNALFYIALGAALLAIGVSLSTDLVVRSVLFHTWGTSVIGGPLFLPTVVFVTNATLIYSYGMLAIALQKTQNSLHRQQITIVLAGSVATLVFGMTADFLLPFVFGINEFLRLTGAATFIESVFFFIAVRQYNMLDITVESIAGDLFDAVADGLVITGVDGTVERMNGRARTLLGVERIAPGTSFKSIVRSDLAFNDTRECELANGTSIMIIPTPVTRSGISLGMLYIIHDVTEHRRAENMLAASEARYRMLIENGPDIIYAYDRSGVFTYISPSVSITGYAPEEVIGKKMIDFIHPDDAPMVSEAMRQAVTNGIVRKNTDGTTRPLTFRIITKSGSILHIEVKSTVIRDAAGNVTTVTGVLRDITERERMAEALAVSEAKYRTIVENSQDILYSVNTSGIITYISQSAFAYGFAPQDIIGRPLMDFIHPDDQDLVTQAFEQAIRTAEDRRLVFRVLLKNGAVRIIEEMGKAVTDPNGKVIHLTGVMRDITERRYIEEQLEVRTTELEMLNSIIAAASAASSIDDLLASMVSTVLTRMHFDVGMVHLIGENKDYAALQYTNIDDAAAVEHIRMLPLDKSPYDAVFRRAQTVMHFRANPILQHMHAYALLPLCSGTRVIGALSVMSERPRTFTDSESRILSAIAGETGTYINRMMTEAYTHSIKTSLDLKTRGISNAQKLQRNLNTKTLPLVPDVNIASFYMPSEELGGDFFDIRQFGNHTIIIIADCSGHGIEASMAATLLKSIADRYIDKLADGDPGQFLSLVNRDTVVYFSEQNFPTMFSAVINTDTKVMHYANAGSPLPFVIHRGRVSRLVKTDGFMLGYDTNARYETRSRRIKEGEILFIASDAFSSVLKNDRLIFDTAWMRRILSKFGHGLSNDLLTLISSVGRLIDIPLKDDTTVLLVEHIQRHECSITLRGGSRITANSEKLGTAMMHRGYTDEEIAAMRIAFDEMCLNAVEHGNSGNALKKVVITMQIDCVMTTVTVTDEGNGFIPSQVPDPTSPSHIQNFLAGDSTAARGRGIWITARIVDRMTYNEKGNRVTIEKRRNPSHTQFHYKKEIAHAAPAKLSQRGNVIIWDSGITLDRIRKMNQPSLTIDFADLHLLSSFDMGKLCILARQCTTSGTSLKLITHSAGMKTLLKETGIENRQVVIE
ncbi:MAG: PAS domain S-box protein [Spirochaetes bacterium]|nr:PAS domain S-box protein [Spirochaetota bacterium]